MNSIMTTDVKMTSLDIAEVTGKRHADVMRDIRKEIDELGDKISRRIFAQSKYKNERGREYECYELGKEGAMQLALKYDAKTRYNVIQYVEQLEKQPRVLNEREQLVASMKLSIETAEEFKEIKEDVSYLKGNMRIDSLQQQDLQKSARLAVVQALGGKNAPAYKEMSRKVFPAMWNEFKNHFKVPRYPDLPKIKYDEAEKFIELWRPSTSLQIKIDNSNDQMSFVKE